jgi:hypothetical protein
VQKIELASAGIKVLALSFTGAAAVKVWAIFVITWSHGGHHQWEWQDAKYVVVNGALLTFAFCIVASIDYFKNRL